MAEKNASRPRITFDVSSDELNVLKTEAKAEQISVGELVRKSLPFRRTLKMLSEANLEVILQNSQGEKILQMPTPLFMTFLESNPQLIEHFIKGAPKS